MATFFEVDPDAPFDPATVLNGCVEGDNAAVLIDDGAAPPEFFDLASGVAGELLHKLGTYRICLAGVVADESQHPERFQEFLRETNAGRQFRFFRTRDEAITWLESL